MANPSTSQELGTTCFGFQYKHSDQVLFVSDSGKVYRTDIHKKAESDAAIMVEESVEAHFGPFTNINSPRYGRLQSEAALVSVPASVTGLYLSSSYYEYRQSLCAYLMMTDYVYGVKWCHGVKYACLCVCIA